MKNQIFSKVKCFFYSHNWEYQKSLTSHPMQNIYKCRRCGKEDKV